MGISGNELMWLRGLFQKYYRTHPVTPPYDVSRREFGYGSTKKIDNRHVTFENTKELNAFLQNQAPLYLSASVSEFFNPGAQPISTKGIMGSDLIYEFDADDIPSDCKQEHDSWSCPACGAKGKGRVLKCTSCAKGTNVEEWVCEKCLRQTNVQTRDLVRVLMDDFSFEEKDFHFNFSGSKGYHVHVRSQRIYTLPKSARAELMDYLSFHEFDAQLAGFSFDGKQFTCPRYTHASGHAKRILDEILRLIEKGDESEWTVVSGVSPRTLKPFLARREELFKEVHAGILPALPGKKTEAFWNSVLASIVEKKRHSIDRMASGDMHRLMRVPDTLHGSTGLVAKSFKLTELDAFDPFVHALAFTDIPGRKLLVRAMPKLTWGSETLGPLQNEEIMVSGPIAAYLVGWGAAELR